MRKRNRFARVGILSIALLLSLCVTGIGYAAWTGTVGIYGTVETGFWVGVLSEPVSGSENITLSVVPPNTLSVSVSYAQANHDYIGSFKVNNTGTVPIKIENIVLAPPSGTTATVSGVSAGDQIDPGEMKSASVNTSTSIGCKSYDFTVTFTFVLWNE